MNAVLRERWQHLARRDRQLCAVLAVFLLAVFGVYGLWLPASAAKVSDQPLASRLSESAAGSGLNVEQFELDTGGVRISLNGDAVAVLGWLNRIEQEGARFASLILEKRDSSLQARLQINN